MRVRPRSLLPFVLILGVVASVAPFAPVAAADAAPAEATLVKAEATALDRINAERTKRGLVVLRLDPRLASLARERADYMAQNDLLSHTHAGGQAVWDLMSAGGITWYRAGEIIAYNTTTTLATSALTAVKSWMGSPPHKAIALSSDYNYVGFGLGISTSGKRYWAGVFLKGPDLTGAWSRITSVTKRPVSSTLSRVTIRWAGADIRLSVLTSGLHAFDIQRRTDGGEWYDYGTTKSSAMRTTWFRGRVYQFRVRARDEAGNWGGWKIVTVRP